MRVLCCGPAIWGATAASVAEHARGRADFVVLRPGDWQGYYRAVAERWGAGDLLNVEQDMLLHADVIPQLEACPEPWCLFPYRHPCAGPDAWLDTTALGCARFRLEFQQAVPMDAIAAVYGHCGICDGQPDKHMCWVHLEGRISDAGRAAGFRPHVHSPSVGHRDVPPGEPYEIPQPERQL